MEVNLKEFKGEALQYVDTNVVKDGVVCDVYKYVNDDSRDIAFISVEDSVKTPLQKVMNGERTIEGFVSGEGILKVARKSGKNEEYKFPSFNDTPVDVHKGDVMQWESLKKLVFFEECVPPYKEGRFENINEDDL